MKVEISDVAKSLVALDDELNDVIDAMSNMNCSHLRLMLEIHNEHRAQMQQLERKAKVLSDAIHKIEMSLVGGVK